MSAVNLDKSLETLKKSYIGKNKEGVHQLDKSKVDELSFIFAMNRVMQAVQSGELTEKEMMKRITKRGW